MMPVTTRSKSQRQSVLLTTLDHAKSDLFDKPPTKTNEDSSCTTSNYLLQDRDDLKEYRKVKQAFSSLQIPRKRSYKHQGPGVKKQQPQIAASISPQDIPYSTITHWSCGLCSCTQGAFDCLADPADTCIRCGHDMDNHEEGNHFWNSNCPHVCERQNLVASILRLLDSMRVVVIRATPQVGKTTLLWLLGRHVLDKRLDLEPVFVHWKPREERKNLPYLTFLQ